jgi:hypothetical protein
LAELTGQAGWIERATGVADQLLELFADPHGGGLFTTGHDAEALVVRPKDLTDGALPSTNSIAALALLRLGGLTGDERYRTAGAQLVAVARPLLAGHAGAVADLVLASGHADQGAEVVVAGDRPDLVEVIRQRWLPTAVVAWGQPGHSALWQGRRPGTASVCRAFTCQAPTGDPGTLAGQLDALGHGG